MSPEMTRPALPWWRVPAAWLVVGGPLLVVAASLATLAIAVRGGDRPLRVAPQVAAPSAHTMTPATQARNHAAAARR
jgi:hypothetical protein